VHAGINGRQLTAKSQAHPDADLYVHPECGCATSALYLASAGAVPAEKVKILSTGDMVTAAREAAKNAAKNAAPTTVLVATEIGMLHQLRRAAPGVDFRAVNERASCRYMKMITPGKLLASLREMRDEVRVDPEIARRARGAVERMIAIGQPGGGE
jgi:quinolinate synthase